MPAGRPSDFNQEIADKICDRLANGESLRKISCDEGMPGQTTLYRWLKSNDEFREQYAHARELQADTIFDEILDIADDATNDWMERHGKDNVGWEENGEALRRSQLRIEARKWMAGKLKGKYSDKLTVQTTSTVTHRHELAALTTEQLEAIESIIDHPERVEGGTGNALPPPLH